MDFNMNRNKESLQRDIGNYIRRSRKNNALTGAELGKKLHISQQQISRYERGETSINIETLGKILSILDKDWSDFFLSVLAVPTNR
ncbi:helix-turn-helix transcriptional regulator [Providencia rettgeri]|nr:helix-turn-helix transcriptional regulator [Providencia rettgeri]